jgi:hypothetical protein
VHDALGNFTEASQDSINGKTGGHLTLFLAANSVCKGEEPSLGLDLGWRGWKDVAEKVFIVAASQAGVGEFGKFKV